MSFIRNCFGFLSSSTANGHNNERGATMRFLISVATLMAVLGLFPAEASAIDIPKDAKGDMTSATTQAGLDTAKAAARTACVNAYITDADIKACKTAVSALWKTLKEKLGDVKPMCPKHGVRHPDGAVHKRDVLKPMCLLHGVRHPDGAVHKKDVLKPMCLLHGVRHPDGAVHTDSGGSEMVWSACLLREVEKGSELAELECPDDTRRKKFDSDEMTLPQVEDEDGDMVDAEVEDGRKVCLCDDDETVILMDEDGELVVECPGIDWLFWAMVIGGPALAIILFIIWWFKRKNKKIRKKVKKDAGGDTGGDGGGLVDCARDGCVGRGVPGEYCGKCRDQLSVPPTLTPPTPAVTQVAGAAPVIDEDFITHLEVNFPNKEDLQNEVAKAQKAILQDNVTEFGARATVEACDRELALNNSIIEGLEKGGDPREVIAAALKAANEATQERRDTSHEICVGFDAKDSTD